MATIFAPVKGEEAKIRDLSINDGYVYFATDTGKVFMDVNDKRIAVGGSGASIYYATCQAAIENIDGSYGIPKADLEDVNVSPKEDDLIINIDGTFYKVLREVNDAGIISCKILAVSGSGSGGGTGGGSGGSSTDYIEWVTLSGIETGSIFIAGQPANIKLRAKNTLGNRITYTIRIVNEYAGQMTTTVYQVGDTTYPNDTEVTFDLGSVMQLGTSRIVVMATADDCGTATRERNTINTVEMRLDKDPNFNALRANPIDQNISFMCMPVGENINKTIKLYLDGELYATRKDITSSGMSVTMTIEAGVLGHGSHSLKAEMLNAAETVSCELNYEIIVVDPKSELPIIWIGDYKQKIINHEALNIPYMVYDPKDTAHAEVYYFVNDKRLPSSYSVAYSNSVWQNWRVIDYIVGENTIRIETTDGMAEKEVIIEVKADSRNMDIVEDAYLVYDAEGRSNKENVSSRTTWLSSGTQKTAVEFNNFNWYNNGWITDEDGNTCLRVSNGASVSIPLNIMKSEILANGYTFEFELKLRNVKTYANLIKTTILNPGEEIPKIEKEVSSTDGVLLKYYGGGVGFCLGTQEGFFSSRNTIINGRYSEDRIIHISFVIEKEQQGVTSTPLMYMYIDGVNSGVATYVTNDDDFKCTAMALEINSEFCDVDVYKIRVYRSALQARQVVQNLIADYADVDMYDINTNIVKYNNNIPTIDYKAVVQYNIDHKDAPLMPYAVIETLDQGHTLPYKKIETGDAWNVNIEFTNPYLDYLWASGAIDDDTYIKHCPSYSAQGADLNVQGTSSQGYPRRNYKAKFKPAAKANKWIYTAGPKKGESFSKWYMDSEIGTNKFTWKADYMESSRTHNSGFASFVRTLYTKHPLQDYGVSSSEADKYRTSVYGFPMMLFHKKSDDDYEFIGLYNYNLDKSCDDNFGFCDIKGVTSKMTDGKGNYLGFSQAAECWELEHNQGGRCSFAKADFADVVDSNGLVTVVKDFEVRYHPDKDSIENATFGNGDNIGDGIIDFSNATIEARNKYLLSKYARIEKVIEWVASTNKANATNNPLETPVTYDKEYTVDNVEYRLAKFRSEFENYFDREYCEIYFIMTELLICYDSRGKNLMLATWGPKVEGGPDVWYPIFYDIDTQLGVNNSGVPYWDYYTEPTNDNVFSTPDSVLWNNFWECFKTNIIGRYNQLRGAKLTISNLNGYYNFDPEVSKSYAMYGGRPIMAINVDEYYKYIDCAIGGGYVDTTGASGQHTSTFFYCLQGTRELQRALFLRNRFIYLDSQWQAGDFSVTGAKQGFQLRYEANDIENTSDKYIHGVNFDTQGNVTEMPPETKQEWKGKGYMITDKYPYNEFDSEFTFEITPYLKQYLTIYHDETPGLPFKCEDGEQKQIPLSDEDMRLAQNSIRLQQILYVPEAAYISSLGDVSNKYLDQFYIQGGVRLKDIILGNDKVGYMNTGCVDDSLNLEGGAKMADGSPNPNAKPMLEKVILSNLSAVTKAIDLSGSEKLREFRALGTSISSVILSEGSQIETLHLPSSVSTINLTEPTSLTKVLTTKPMSDGKYTNEVGLYVENITDKTVVDKKDVTKLNKISIIGGNMGYSSYQLLDTAVRVKQMMQVNEELDTNTYSRSLSINMENINWTPYRKVEYGEVPFRTINLTSTIYEPGKYYVLDNGEYKISNNDFSVAAVYYTIPYTYVKKTEHYTFEDYPVPSASWKKDTLNGYIYEYDAAKDSMVMTDLHLLDVFINSYLGSREENYFTDTSIRVDGDISNRKAYLSGNIFVHNENSDIISEAKIRNYYKMYYPDLEIFVAKVEKSYTAKFIRIDTNSEGDEIEVELDSLKYDKSEDKGEGITPDISSVVPVRLHYDFRGWSLDPKALQGYGNGDSSMMYPWSDLKLDPYSDNNDTYVFYAIFSISTYPIKLINGPSSSNILHIPYNQIIGDTKAEVYWNPIENMGYVPDEAYNNENQNKVYHFIGWHKASQEEERGHWTKGEGQELLDLTKIRATEPLTLAGSYKLIDIDKNVYPELFTYTTSGNKAYIQGIRGAGIGYTSKITLPTNGEFLVQGRIYEELNGLKDVDNQGLLYLVRNRITQIYWQNPEMVDTLSNSSFFNSPKLTYIELPSKVSTIPEFAFNSVSQIKYSADYFDNITSIGNWAFTNNSGTNELYLPAKVKSLGQRAFSNWSNLTTIVFGEPGEPLALLDDDNLNQIVATTGNNDLNDPGVFCNCGKINSVTFIGSNVEEDSIEINTLKEKLFLNKAITYSYQK